ncbi:flagellar biosynthetic protein FliO [Chitinimonas sp. PSY-7]|uniref:flagellar biosynthetic protein FliO n=1 Tax=Chitinimonas sp. PSY-7 TaxID=3459088 RepID=UPI00403FEAD3
MRRSGLFCLFLCLFAGTVMAATGSVEGAAIPFKQTTEVDGMIGRVVGALVLVALVGVAAAVLIRRFLPGFAAIKGKPSTALQVTHRQRLTPNSQLIVVTYHQEELLLVEGPQGVQLLRTTPLAPESGEQGNG